MEQSNKEPLTLYNYIIGISPEEKYDFYEEAYKIYMERLEKSDQERYNLVKETENMLSNKNEIMVLYIFQRIVPTLCNNDPIHFLQRSIINYKEFLCDDLLVFLQIAGFRWTTIEKSFKKSEKSRKGQKGNKSWNKKDNQYLIPLFAKMQELDKERGKKSFIKDYKQILVPWFIENWNSTFHNKLKELKKERKLSSKEKRTIDCIIMNYNMQENEKAKKELEKFQPVQAFYREKYTDWCENQSEECIHFRTANTSFRLSELQETIWKKQTPWQISLCKQKYPEIKDIVIEKMDNHEFVGMFQNEIERIKSNVQTNKKAKKNSLTEVQIAENKIESLVGTNVIQITPDEKALLYQEIYYYYKMCLAKMNQDLFRIIDEIEKTLSSSNDLGMLLYMFQRIVPTFCDYTPFILLFNALESMIQDKDYSLLCEFMQIASFRWGRIEENVIALAESQKGQSGHKWISSKEGMLLSPIMEKMREESNGVYDIIFFDKNYESLIIPELLKDWKLLYSKLNVIKSKQKNKNIVDEIIKAHDLNDRKTIISLIFNLEPLRRHFREEYKKICSSEFNDNYFFFRSIKRFISISDLQKKTWCRLEPWSIVLSCSDPKNCNEYAINLLKEATYLNEFSSKKMSMNSIPNHIISSCIRLDEALRRT